MFLFDKVVEYADIFRMPWQTLMRIGVGER
jgi:hypothetical protein